MMCSLCGHAHSGERFGFICTGEITMTAAEYAVFRERAHSAFRTPGWESPELRVLGPEAD